jgi:cullin-associated NEDD8-dissociated protein 1
MEVKEQALLCLGAVVYHGADLIPAASVSGQVIPLLLDRLQNESYRLVTIKVISHILTSPFDKSLVDFTPVLSPVLAELSSFLRKAHRQLKLSSLQCLELLLNRYHGVQKDVLEPLMSDLNLLMKESDLHIVSRTISLFTVVIKTSSSNKFVMTELKNQLIPTLISIMVENPHLLVSGPGAGSLTTFWNAVWEAGDLSLHDACLTLLAKTGKSDKSSRQTLSVVAKSMAIIASRGEKDWMLKLVHAWVKGLKKASPTQQHLSLLALGEVGSRVDLTSDIPDLFSVVFGYFSSPSEEVKYAAAFALGNISLGNVEKSLPNILDAIRKNDTHRFLLFITLKEIISKLASVTVAPEHLRKVAPDIWSLLIQNLDSVDEDTIRNAIAECLGKISLFDPNTYMPQLQGLILSEKSVVRSTAITAVRFTLTDTLVPQDEFELALTPLLYDILSIPQNADTLVIRMALSTLTSAAHNKPSLVKRMIGQVCAFVYRSTAIREELIQMVDFGPFKHRVDDGLEARKAAFECMDTLLDSCLPSIEIHEFITHVVAGLADESDEIKIIAFLMLQRLTQLHPKSVAQKLDLIIAPLKACLTRKLKDNAVKQELERTKDLKRAATRCCILVSNVAHDSPTFTAFIEEMKAASTELTDLFTAVASEISGGHGMVRNKSVDMMEM